MKVTVTILDERLNVKVSTSKIEVPVYHKVTNGGTEQIQSDFDQTDETAVDFIKNKPTIPSIAAQITVSDPVTPDFTPAVQGDNLQEVTNKVAGLQDYLIDLTTDVKVNEINITHDKNGNPLAIPFGSILELFIYVPFFVDINDDVITGRVNLRLNGISTTSYRTLNLSGKREIYLAGASYAFQQTKVTLVHAGNVFYSLQNAQNSSINNQVYSGYTQITLTNITSINLLNFPAQGDFCGAGTKVLLKLL